MGGGGDRQFQDNSVANHSNNSSAFWRKFLIKTKEWLLFGASSVPSGKISCTHHNWLEHFLSRGLSRNETFISPLNVTLIHSEKMEWTTLFSVFWGRLQIHSLQPSIQKTASALFFSLRILFGYFKALQCLCRVKTKLWESCMIRVLQYN